MPESGAEQAMRRACDRLLAGDIMSVAADLTPEAYADAMALAAGITSVPALQSYSIEPAPAAGSDVAFRARFQTSAGDFLATATWREVEGAWRIVAIRLDGRP